MASDSPRIESYSGGLLGAEENLQVLWVAIRAKEHISVVHSGLLKESGLSDISSGDPPEVQTAEEDIRAGNPRFYVPNLQVPWATDLKQQVKKYTGLQIVTVGDDFGVLRIQEILDVLSSPCRYGARWNETVRLFYKPLAPEYGDYNSKILRALGVQHTLERIFHLVRISYLDRLLAILRRRCANIRTERDRVRNAASPIQPMSPPLSEIRPLRISQSPSIRTSGLSHGVAPPHIAKLRRCCMVMAEPVRDSSRSASMAPREYIVGGICVPAHLLNDVEATLIRDYRLYIQVTQPARMPRYSTHSSIGSLASLANNGTALLEHPPVCNVISPLLEPLPHAVAATRSRSTPPTSTQSSNSIATSNFNALPQIPTIHPAQPHPLHIGLGRSSNISLGKGVPPGRSLSSRHLREHSSVEQYLRNCFGVGWSATLNAALRNARRKQRELQLASLCTILAQTEESLKTGNELRGRLTEMAVKQDMEMSGLAGFCAISLVRNTKAEKFEELKNVLPINVWKKVVDAKNRLSVLQSQDGFSLDAIL